MTFFFFYGCVTHRDLHSFPTRRSSDLGLPLGGRRGLRRQLLDRRRRRRVGGDRDRKSTRLNSSHRCTSYAVFCLKKKKDRTTSRTTAGSRQTRTQRACRGTPNSVIAHR